MIPAGPHLQQAHTLDMGGNSTGCPVHYLPDDPKPFITEDGDFNIKLHYVGWIVAGFFGLIGSGASFWLIKKHLEFYTKPSQQKYIVRILFMVPCYAVYSWLSYYWWKEALYFQLLRDCYEAVVIASFFSLLLHYLGDSEEEHAIVFKNVKFKKWIWPFGRWRYKPSGPRFLSIMQWSIGQYWICRPGCTLAAVITEALDLYCLSSWSPRFSHVWTSTVICISVTVAMYAILQFYVTMKVELAPYQPMLKFFAVKAVVFLTFWGECMLVLLASVGVIKGNVYWSAHEIQVGISAVLSCFVMMIFGFLHVKAFTYRSYRGESLEIKERKLNKTNKLSALGDVLDFRDVGRDIWTGAKQIVRLCTGRKGETNSGMEDDHFGNALGRTRIYKAEPQDQEDATKALMKQKTDVEKELDRVNLSREKDAADQAFVRDSMSNEGADSVVVDPWQETRPAFRPHFSSICAMSSTPSSALCVAPTISVRSDANEPISFGDVRRFPKSSTGILYPSTALEQDAQRVSLEFPEKLDCDAGETVYGQPTSWFKRLFPNNAERGTSRTLPTALVQVSKSRGDPVVDEILEDRSKPFDYSSGSTAMASRDAEPREFIRTRTDRLHHKMRDGLRMPDPLSPARYPGFDEQAYVDQMYALHANTMDVIPSQLSFSVSLHGLGDSHLSAATSSGQPRMGQVSSNRVIAHDIILNQSTGHALDSIGS